MGQFADASQSANVAALDEVLQPVGEGAFRVALRIRQQTPGAGKPIVVESFDVVGIWAGKSSQKHRKHGTVAPGNNEGADEAQFGFLGFVKPGGIGRRKAEPTVLAELQRRPPVETNFLAN